MMYDDVGCMMLRCCGQERRGVTKNGGSVVMRLLENRVWFYLSSTRRTVISCRCGFRSACKRFSEKGTTRVAMGTVLSVPVAYY
jgi:hypothetical protein